MPARALPDSPSLEHLKAQAKDMRKQHAAHSMMAAQRLREFHPTFRALNDEAIFATSFTQAAALLAIAREYGFASWPRLKAHIEGPPKPSRWSRPQQEWITDPLFRTAVDHIDSGNVDALRKLLLQHPPLVHQQVTFEGGNYFHTPTLLNFVAENPVRNGKLPANITEVTQAILDFAPNQQSKDETLMLVATGSIPRECNVQRQLIALLCKHGAEPNQAAKAAAVLNEPGSVTELLQQGAAMTPVIAAALDLPFDGLLATATEDDLQTALSVAAHYGHAEAVSALLQAGADPNRYNPPGGHAHATPLHLAVDSGSLAVVQLLLDHGARTDIKDVLWNATPLGWAEHENKPEIAALLRTHPA